MRYVTQLAAPLIVPVALAVGAPMPELNIIGLQAAVENLLFSYLAFSAPHWIWLAASGVFEASDSSTVGGLFGLNTLLVCVTLLVFLSPSYEAANGWFLYFLGTPIAIVIGTAGAKFYAARKFNQSA